MNTQPKPKTGKCGCPTEQGSRSARPPASSSYLQTLSIDGISFLADFPWAEPRGRRGCACTKDPAVSFGQEGCLGRGRWSFHWATGDLAAQGSATQWFGLYEVTPWGENDTRLDETTGPGVAGHAACQAQVKGLDLPSHRCAFASYMKYLYSIWLGFYVSGTSPQSSVSLGRGGRVG